MLSWPDNKTKISRYTVQSGVTPLWIASFNGHQKCVELLINAGANVDVQEEVSVSTRYTLR